MDILRAKLRKWRPTVARSSHELEHKSKIAGCEEPSPFHDPLGNSTQGKPEDRSWLEHIGKIMGNENINAAIDCETFKQILGIEKEFYADRFFEILDIGKRGFLTSSELASELSTLAKSDVIQKLKFIFDLYDLDGNGLVDQTEFNSMLAVAINDNALAISPHQIQQMTQLIFESFDENNDGVLSFTEFRAVFDKSPDKITSLQISASRFLRPPRAKTVHADAKNPHWKSWCTWPHVLTPEYAERHPVEFWWTVFYILSLIAFFLYGWLHAIYEDHKISSPTCLPFFVVAKGFGKNLNWNCLLLILLMCRLTLKLLRNSQIGSYLPIDMVVYVHKIIGWITGTCVIGHWISHMIHFQCLAWEPNATLTYSRLLFKPVPSIGWFDPGVASVTGWPLLFLYVVIFICALPFVRRSGRFEVFYFTHLMYIPFVIILIIHSDEFWKFIIIPGTIFVLEKISLARCVRRMIGSNFHIKEVTLWDKQVTKIVMNYPPGFIFNPGDYLFINIPVIAWFEWHPFTISSCPEYLDCVTLHMRCAGQWTNRVHSFFQKQPQSLNCVVVNQVFDPTSVRRRSSQPSNFAKNRQTTNGETIKSLHVQVNIDGAYETPTARIFNNEHVVLVCAGIGVTPFAAILQSILYRHRADKISCPDCGRGFSPNTDKLQTLKKVNFIWVVNNQRTIEWFAELLEQIDEEQEQENQLDKFVEIQIYVTGAKKMGDLYAFGLTTALDVFYEKHHKDMITGIRARPITGRPEWSKVFKAIDQEKRGPVSVFFCGPAGLAKDLATNCRSVGFKFFKESF